MSDVRKLTGTPLKLLSELAELAFQAHEQGVAIFDDNFLQEQAQCSDEALQLGLLSSYSVEEGLEIVHQYSFQHLTVQEFLVAYRLVAHITSEEDLNKKVSVLISSTHNDVVLQFFAGLLAERLRARFFTLLNNWLHTARQYSDDRHSRLRVCLQCAKEACGGDVKYFPSTLKLPERVYLDDVTAADVTQLSFAVENSQHIELLYLEFDSVEVESANTKVSRVMRQTRRAVTNLMVAVNANKSLRTLILYGPEYSLFEERGWRLLAQTLEKNSLVELLVNYCELDNTTFHFLSNALKHNTQLEVLWLLGNGLNDVSVCTLADDLKHNKTLRHLNLRHNSYGEESRARLRQELKHINQLDL